VNKALKRKEKIKIKYILFGKKVAIDPKNNGLPIPTNGK
jgi:hypothetical protein